MDFPCVPLFTGAQVRAHELNVIGCGEETGFGLMQRAGASIFRLLRYRWTSARKVCVVCGPGNNGGDGLVLARLLSEANIDAAVALVCNPDKYTGDARRAYQDWLQCANRGKTCSLGDLAEHQFDVIVDALFGSGLSREVEGDYAQAINSINSQSAPVLAVDVPSGVCSQTGSVFGCAVQAHATVSFVGRKRGLYTGRGPGLAGDITFIDLDIPAHHQADTGNVHLVSQLPSMPRRKSDSHKGCFGHVLCVGACPQYTGAINLAASAVLNVGAGMVSVAAHPDSPPETLSLPTEAIRVIDDIRGATASSLSVYDVILVGPGLGCDSWATAAFEAVLDSEMPLVIDADALTLLGENELKISSPAVMTPHPGEAARMLGTDSASIQQDRFASARALQQRYSGVVVLKGNGTVVQSPTGTSVIGAGNPAMAAAGMGDVLAGTIAGLMAQGLAPDRAAIYGSLLHAQAGDYASERLGNGLKASDVAERLRHVSVRNT
ncbi:MAG: NAD(P)H-hydrate dehydratase [Pseudomonadota bacterium]